MASEATASQPSLTRADFVSNQEVRWCPGCGDYAILAMIQRTLPELGVPKEDVVFVSGIGCSSRLPYYMNTYGFHSIHGRAPTLAAGIKMQNPKLQVWVITGDGDALSIGGNHLIHVLRRNIDLKILLFNNRIYGLTKGQYSPTSEKGKHTKSSPYGSIDYPIEPITIALGAEATFVARTLDTDAKLLGEILKAAAEHKGSAFVEIYQNCVIFNDNAFSDISDRQTRSDRVLYLQQGKPLIFGAENNKGIRFNGCNPEVVTLGKDGVTEKDLVVHDAHTPSPTYAFMLSQMHYPAFPTPFGIFRQYSRPTYDQMAEEQIATAKQQNKKSIVDLLNSGETWTVK